MTQTEKIKRTVPGAELFFGESVAQYLADLSDEAYAEETETEGLLLGRIYHDDGGEYAVISGVSGDLAQMKDAVGWFRSSDGRCDIDQSDVRRIISLFGYVRVYVIAVDYSQGAMAMYAVENGVARKVPSAMIENF